MNYSKRILIVALLACFQTIAWSQDPTYNSPYSRFGIGDLTNPNLMTTRAMGNTGSSYFDNYTLNPVNPASYSFLTLTTYNVGINAEYSRIQDNVVSEDRWNGNLDYMGLAFPLRNYKNELLDPKKRKVKFGMAFLLKPYSTVSYDVQTVDTLGGNGIQRNFIGNGGTYNVSWGNSIRYKNFSFGVNLGYIFGKITNKQLIGIVSDPVALQDNITNSYNIRGFDYKLGALYQLILNEEQRKDNKTLREKKIAFGIQGNLGSSFTTQGEFSHIGVSPALPSVRDTIAFAENLTGEGTLPATVGIGINYYDGNKFNIGLDVEYGAWANFKNTIRPDQELTNILKVGVGGQYIPDERGFGSFLERVSYQFGAYYNQDPRVIQGEQINNYGITLGMGMPFFYQQKFSKVNVTLNLGQRGAGTIISENFVQLGLGFNFNDDSWFIRRKYN